MANTTSSLETASTYINNLLLSRGLLRDGKTIDFAHPSRGEGGREITLARIVTVAHDLILRRDKESDALSSLTHTLSALQSTTANQSQTVARLEEKASDLERRLVQSVDRERGAKKELKHADAKIKVLREDVARLKGTVGQVRAQCANDVRKREGEVRRLQRHLEGKRGMSGVGAVGVVVVQPGEGWKKRGWGGTMAGTFNGNGNMSGWAGQAQSGGLAAETNAHLTQLSRSLGEENDALADLLQGTITTLQHLQGLPSSDSEGHCSASQQGAANDPDITTLTTTSSQAAAEHDPNIFLAPLKPSLSSLSNNIQHTLTHLRHLLTSPSFVAVEELEARDDEIARLREGWDKMESRWREALGLMNEWRMRMDQGGERTINVEDIKKGLGLGKEEIVLPAPTRSPEVMGMGRRTRARVSEGESFLSDGTEISVLPRQRGSSEGDSQDAEEGESTPGPVPEAFPSTRVEQNRSKPKTSPKLGIGLLPPPTAAKPVLQPTTGNARKQNAHAFTNARLFGTGLVKGNSPQAKLLVENLRSDDDDNSSIDELALLDALPSPVKRRRVISVAQEDADDTDNAAEDKLLALIASPELQPPVSAARLSAPNSFGHFAGSPTKEVRAEDVPMPNDEEEEEPGEQEAATDEDTVPLSIEQKLALAQQEAEDAKRALAAAVAGSPATATSTVSVEDGSSNGTRESGDGGARGRKSLPPSTTTTSTTNAAAAAALPAARAGKSPVKRMRGSPARGGLGLPVGGRGMGREAPLATKEANFSPNKQDKKDEEIRREQAEVAVAVVKKPVKRTQLPKRTVALNGKAAGAGGMRRSKRRSTLSPEELEGLVGL